MQTFKCFVCKQVKNVGVSGGTGYGRDKYNRKVCYVCCAIRDEKEMTQTGRVVLYLTTKPDTYGGGLHSDCKVTNWPGSLEFVGRYRRGRHNIAGLRYDAWFKDKTGKEWHGTQYGEMTQILHCKRIGG